jgi:hypothetical protein
MDRTKQIGHCSIGGPWTREQLINDPVELYVARHNLSVVWTTEFERELARTGYAAWAGIPVGFVSFEFVEGSALGLSYWATVTRQDMMVALKKAIQGSFSLFSALSDHLIDYMIYEAGRFDYNMMRYNRACLLELGERTTARKMCAKFKDHQMRATKQSLTFVRAADPLPEHAHQNASYRAQQVEEDNTASF